MKLATKLAIVILVFATTAAALGTELSAGAIKKTLQDNIADSQALQTDQVMDKIDRFLYERTVDIQVITERSQLQTYLQQPATRSPANTQRLITDFNNFRIVAGVWGDMTLVDNSGTTLVTTDGPTQIASLTAQSQFKQAFQAADSGQVVSSDVFMEADGKNPIELFMAPVRAETADKPVIGVVVGELAWATVLQIIGQPGANVTAHLINKNGYILGSNIADPDQDKTEILAKSVADSDVFKNAAANEDSKEETHIFPSLDNPKIQVLSTYEQEKGYLNYHGNNWLLVFETPTSIAFAPATSLARKMIITAMGVTFITMITLMWYTYRAVIRPIRLLRGAMFRIIGGDFDGRVKIHTHDEIGELGTAFNQMASGLQASVQNLNEEHARLKSSIDSLDVGLLMTFKEGEAISYNTMLPQILGFHDKRAEKTELTLATLEAKLLVSEFDLVKAIDNCQKEGKYFEISEITYDDRILSIFGAPVVVAQNTIIGTVFLFEDITEAKLLERSKDEFFSIASHELRTPLTSIRGNSSMILDFYKDTLDKDVQLKEMVEDMNLSAVRLIDIVNDFLDVSRLEQGKMRFDYKPTSVQSVIEGVAYEMKAVLAEKQIYLKIDKLTLDKLPKVWADENRLKQVVYNLVGNASKFTDEGGIWINTSATDSFVKVSVTDSGRGMTAKSQQLLFRKFQQASSSLLTRDTTRGTGLGLYISKMIVENMGGTIALDSSIEGKGSTFSFTVPLVTQALMDSAAALAKIDTTTGLTVPTQKLPEQIQPPSENRL